MAEPLQKLFQTMNEPIAPSEELLQKTRQRMAETKPQKWVRRVQKAVAVAACTLLIFTGAVNLSPAFASAVAKVPVVKELAAAVAFDPSMKAAMEHDYIQLVKQSVSDQGYRFDLEYLVADPANLTIYYKMPQLAPEQQQKYHLMLELLDLDGKKLEGYGASWEQPGWTEEEALSKAQFSFTEGTLPEQLQLLITIETDVSADEKAEDEEAYSVESVTTHLEEPLPEYTTVACMTIPLTIDQDNLFNARTLELHHTVQVDGQTLIFDQVEIYPTQMRVLWREDEANNCWIEQLGVTLRGNKHGRWEKISNGISGIGILGEPRQVWLDSSWFAEETVYQLVIEQYSLVPKETQQVTYEYSTGTFTNLPDYIHLTQAVPCDSGLFLEFTIDSTDRVVHGNVFGSTYLDSNGTEREWNQMGSGSSFDQQEADNGIYHFYNQFIIQGYENGPVTFTVEWAPARKLEKEIIIPLTE
ncbi:MAG: DUF4179 domain-containing protein [Peptococcaceae bacterium]